MKLEHSDEISADVDLVYRIVKDQLSDLAPYLPSIDRIDTMERSSIPGGKEKVVNHWFAQIDMPGLLSKFISKDLLSWKDNAIWDPNSRSVEYQLESFIANNLFEAKGCNKFEAVSENKMRLTLSCEVNINADSVPGVPKLMKKKVTPLIEKIIEKMMKPNITSLGKGLKAYLEANPGIK
ncbi:MAG: hypothetical protein AB8G05_09550 [Oligoflexales bacterium]